MSPESRSNAASSERSASVSAASPAGDSASLLERRPPRPPAAPLSGGPLVAPPSFGLGLLTDFQVKLVEFLDILDVEGLELALVDLFNKREMVVGLSRSLFARRRRAPFVGARRSIAPLAASLLVAVPTGSLVPARFAVPTPAATPAAIRTLAIMASFLLARGTLRRNGCAAGWLSALTAGGGDTGGMTGLLGGAGAIRASGGTSIPNEPAKSAQSVVAGAALGFAGCSARGGRGGGEAGRGGGTTASGNGSAPISEASKFQ